MISTTCRIVSAVLSVLITLVLLNAVALLGYPKPSDGDERLATTKASASVAMNAAPAESSR